MNNCMLQFATREEQDRAREQWFATRELRKKEKEEKERKKKEQEEFHKEWWGLDEKGRIGGRDMRKDGELKLPKEYPK
jgi:COX assembly mitochondrial protein 1